MRSCLTIGCLLFLLCSVICTAEDWSTFPNHDIYPVADKRFCVFPFTFNDKTYNDCTLADGSNGDVPWCSLTSEYLGYIKLCYDFRSSALKCLPFWQMRTGSVMTNYTKCSILSSSIPYPQCKATNGKYINCIDLITKRIDTSYTDRVTCEPKYAALSADHTTCYGPSEYAVQMPLNSSEQQPMIDMHNKHRNEVPDAACMFKVYWDDELAKLAQAHSARCVFEHDHADHRLTPKFGWKNGQNLAILSSSKATPTSIFEAMISAEKSIFVYGYGCNSSDSTCLHYTQLMLDLITRVGCGRSLCYYPDHVDTVITCNYLYSQYGDGYKTTYRRSDTPASACPKFKSDNLCDCGDIACNYDNGDYLDPDTCTCKTAPSKRSINKRNDNFDETSDYRQQGFVVESEDFVEFNE